MSNLTILYLRVNHMSFYRNENKFRISLFFFVFNIRLKSSFEYDLLCLSSKHLLLNLLLNETEQQIHLSKITATHAHEIPLQVILRKPSVRVIFSVL